MLLRELLLGFDIIESRADLDIEIADVCYDSRKVKAGSLFIAIQGAENDGHRFIDSAFDKGAVAVICQKRPESTCPYILAADSRLALALVSVAFFGNPAKKLKLIGVTGTNGKTTITTILKEMLEECTGKKVGLIGTLQNMIGARVLPTEHTTPESRDLQELLRQMVEDDCEYAVMEVSSHSLVLSRVAGIGYTACAFTNLSQDHLDFHITMDNYLEAKSRLFEISDLGIINVDDSASEFLIKKAKCPVIKYGIDSDTSDLKAVNITMGPASVTFDARYKGECVPMELKIPGRFSVYNGLAAIACCLTMDIDMRTISNAMSKCRGVKGRAEVVPTPGRDFNIIIDYAHTPDALENILRTVRGFAKGRVVTLFGCGGDRDRTKRPIMGKIGALLSELVIVTSDNPRTEEPGVIIEDILKGIEGTGTEYTVIEDRREAIRWAIENAKKDDIIILAGKGHETYQILGNTKHHMDEREIVAEILEQ